MAKGITIDLIVDPKGAVEGIGQVEEKASSASNTLGTLGGIAGAALAGLAAAAVAGAVALGTAVVQSYAEYEQLAGGVTKLFGDADATVSKFAANAATSAGLSTNQYLDTVTSFSASLISGLNGDQEAAARAADVAITDMADNANTFGTSMDSLQLAYQGFAKGQFGLLDNLKLGYGGSASEMARLINESGVLGDSMQVTAETVKDVPFDKMIEAIHHVQTEMNIAGTTSREAASTIQGSFAATKASLQNLVLGLGQADADFSVLVGNVVQNAQNLLTNVAPVIGRLAEALPMVVPLLLSAVQEAIPMLLPLATNLVTAILAGIVQMAPMLIQGAVPLIVNLVTGIVEQLPAIVDAAAQVLVALVDGVAAAAPKLIPAIVSAVLGMVQALLNDLPMLIGAGIKLLLGIVQGIVASIPTLVAALPQIISALITGILGGITQIIQAGITLITSLVADLPTIINAIVAALPTILSALIDGLISAIPQLIMAGIQLLVSLVGNLPAIIQGIVSALPDIILALVNAVVDAIPQLIEAGIQLLVSLVSNLPAIIEGIIAAVPEIIDALIKTFGDPKFWAAMGDAGWRLIQGLWEGIKNAGSWLWDQISSFFGGIIDGIKNLLGIHSPSTVFAGFGKNLVLGLEKGLTGPNSLNGIMADLSDQVTEGFSGSLAASARATVEASGGVSMNGGGGDIVINIQTLAPSAEVGRSVVASIQDYVRAGGTGLRVLVGS